ncbi:MAG: glucose-6-phosphate isomerase [Desulfobacula sp.]|nr:glucose-6-phosphate isomerase [Desulfobacula sp.]
METTHLNNRIAYKNLKALSKQIDSKKFQLKNLINEKRRFKSCSIKSKGFFFDYSKQRINEAVFLELVSLAKETQAKLQFRNMMQGKRVNLTENRAALHTATRHFGSKKIFPEGIDVYDLIDQVNIQIKQFSKNIHNQILKGSTGKPFTDAVIIGIGGSYLGCEFVYTALKDTVKPFMSLHFLPNVDIDNFGRVIKTINPETTLWVIVSKSYTTTETMANLNQALWYMKKYNLNPENHLVTVTAKGSPGDDPSNPVLAAFRMFDFIGGRYSVSSAVGGLPLSLAFGFDIFTQFLKGCHDMDTHALDASEEKNIPLLAALISIWNSNFLMYPAQAIIPYCSALSKLAPHVQQLYMESLGKGVTKDGEVVHFPTGVLIFGEPGTNAQHSFFQLAHQGRPFPIEFIGVVCPNYDKEQAMSKGVSNHQELWANMIAQAKALAIGKESTEPSRCFKGNRPSSTILINDLSPESIGRLLAFYEARTVYEGFVLGINPFDQFGVELGKVTASDIREQIALKNKDAGHNFNSLDPATKFYLNALFNKELYMK